MSFMNRLRESFNDLGDTSAELPTPPGFQTQIDSTSPNTCRMEAVSSTSEEYKLLVNYLQSSCNVTKITRVINPKLWSQFRNAWTLLRNEKTNDAIFSEEMRRETQIPAPSLFNDHLSLLFHGSMHVNKIVEQGFDERLSQDSCLGRAIYMTDDVKRALNYSEDENGMLLVSLAVLGDLIGMSDDEVRISGPPRPPIKWEEGADSFGMVRPSDKTDIEKRNPLDFQFDSVVSRHGHKPDGLWKNEFPLHDRRLIYPLYQVSFSHRKFVNDFAKTYLDSLPPFTYLRTLNGPVSNETFWPYLARPFIHLLSRKRKSDEQEDKDDDPFDE